MAWQFTALKLKRPPGITGARVAAMSGACLAALLGWQPARAQAAPDPAHAASPEVHHVTDWIRTSGDNSRMPYMIVDKVNATVFVFDRDGYLKGARPALLGMARGDDTAPHVGKQSLASIRPEDRTTPAGRFVASIDRDLLGQSILWLDYDNGLAMHRVAKGTPAERRAERLRSPTPDDNRISYGCINVPVDFFDALVAPAFRDAGGIVYILPEQIPARDVFDMPPVDAPSGSQAR